MINTTVDFFFISRGELPFLMNSLKNLLEQEHFKTDKSTTDKSEFASIKDKLPEVFVTETKTLLENPEMRVFLYDLCIEKNRKIVFIGEQEDFDELQPLTPGNITAASFKRPINNKEVVEKLKVIITAIREKNRQKKILIVDDSPAFLRMIAEWLENDYCTEICPSATAAFHMIETNKPDLILLDYEMPICNGAQFLQMLHSEQTFSDIPVIFLTSRDDIETVKQVLSLHPQGYLLKTQAKDAIMRFISEFFEKNK